MSKGLRVVNIEAYRGLIRHLIKIDLEVKNIHVFLSNLSYVVEDTGAKFNNLLSDKAVLNTDGNKGFDDYTKGLGLNATDIIDKKESLFRVKATDLLKQGIG